MERKPEAGKGLFFSMKDDNYYVVQGWMINQLGLSGTELVLYAIIYGFSQDENNKFTGSLKYLQLATGKSRSTVIDNLKKLVDSGLIIKENENIKGVKFSSYKTVLGVRKLDGGWYGNRTGGGTEIGPNNIIDNIEDNSNSLFPDLDDQRKTTFSNSPLTNDEIFEKKFENEISAGVDVWYYRNSINDWCETLPERTKSQQDKKFRTAKGWVSTLARAMRTDKDKGKLKMIEDKKEIDSRFSTLFNEV